MDSSATLDRASRFITWSFMLIAIASPLFLYWASGKDFQNPIPVSTSLVVAAIFSGILLTCALFRVKGYSIDGHDILVHRPIGIRRITLQPSDEVFIGDKKSLKGSIRTFGNGGVFGYNGRFWNFRFRSMIWFVTRLDRTVIIRRRGRPAFVLSPDNPQFVFKLLNGLKPTPIV
jgi:hypothetical protein